MRWCYLRDRIRVLDSADRKHDREREGSKEQSGSILFQVISAVRRTPNSTVGTPAPLLLLLLPATPTEYIARLPTRILEDKPASSCTARVQLGGQLATQQQDKL